MVIIYSFWKYWRWSSFANPTVKCPATEHACLARCVCVCVCVGEGGGGGGLHWLVYHQPGIATVVLLLNVTGRTVLCLDALPLISLYRFLVRTNDSLNLMMCGFQMSRSHLSSFGKSFCIINLLRHHRDTFLKARYSILLVSIIAF